MRCDVSVFIDEYGGTDIDLSKRGVTKFYILTAVIVPASQVETVRTDIELVRRRFFQTGEMKSSRIAQDDQRRRKILEALAPCAFHTFSLAVDKRELERTDGLAYRASFYKRINKMLYQNLVEAYESVSVVADEHGRTEFMDSFGHYINGVLRRDLFTQRQFGYANSRDEVFLQTADVISGTLARCYDPDKLSEQRADFLALLRPKSLGFRIWPRQQLPSPVLSASNEAEAVDQLIRDHCIRQADSFLEQHDESDLEERLRAEFLRFLMFETEFSDDRQFFSTAAILKHLESIGLGIGEKQFRAVVVGPLRDRGVIIASSPSGYKLPVSRTDLNHFVQHANTIVPAMLGRLKRARDALLLATLNELDILDDAAFTYLRTLCDIDETH